MNWKPRVDGVYWAVDSYMGVSSYRYYTGAYHDVRVGNCFRTKSLALKALKDIRKVLKEAKHG